MTGAGDPFRGGSPGPEFSRSVPLSRLAGGPVRMTIEASETERQALARRFGLEALDRLAATVSLRAQGAGAYLLEAEFAADFVQACVVSLEPVRASVSDRFVLRYGPPAEGEREIALAGEEEAFEPLTGQSIDIGEAVAQELSLSLPLFPRDAAASLEEAAPASEPEGPFAALGRLRLESEG